MHTEQGATEGGRDLLQSILFWGLVVTVVLVPLIWLSFTYSRSALPKTFIFQSAGLILGLIAGLDRLATPGRRANHWLVRSVILFMILAALATLFSVDRTESIWGRSGRYEGMLTLLAFGGLFAAAARVEWSVSRLSIMSVVALLTASGLALAGLLQLAGVTLFPRADQATFGGRAFATYGNPNIFAGYLLYVLPLAAASAFAARQMLGRIAGVSAVLLLGVALLATATRGALIALVLGTVLMFALFPEMRRRLVIGVAAMLLVGGGFAAITLSASTETNLAARFTDLVQGQGSVATRGEIWKASVAMIADRPWLGWGPDTYRLVFPSYQTVRDVQLSGGSLADNAHNYPLQLAATLGIPAATIFVLLAVLPIVWLWRIRRSDTGPNEVFLGAWGIGIAAYFAHALFTVNAASVAFLFWIGFGMFAGEFGRRVHTFGWQPSLASSVGDRAPLALVVVLVLVLPVLGILGRPLRADHQFAQGMVWRQITPATAEQYFARAVQFFPTSDRYRAFLAESRLAQAIGSGDRGGIEAALKEVSEVQKMQPRNPDYYRFLVQANLSAFSVLGEESAARDALLWAERGLEVAPNHLELHRLAAQAATQSKEHALAAFHQGIAEELEAQ